jgi:hypothetical protein
MPRKPPKCFINACRSDFPAGTDGRGVKKSRCSRGVAKSRTWRRSSRGTGVELGAGSTSADLVCVRAVMTLEGESPACRRQLSASRRETRRVGRGTRSVPLAVNKVPNAGIFQEPRGRDGDRRTLAGETPRAVEPMLRGNAVDGHLELGHVPRAHPCRGIACTRQGIGRPTSWCARAPDGPIRRRTRR